MIKNKYIQLLFIYVLIVTVLVSMSFFLNAEYDKQLRSTQNKLKGVEYIASLSKLNIDVAKYFQIQAIHKHDKILQKSLIMHDIKTVFELQKRYPHFINKEFNKKLQKLQSLNLTKYEAYNFIESVNKENYDIGNLSEIHFQQSGELYYLGTLVTHYMPEYLLSTLISHGILEEYLKNGVILDKDRNIFIEQNKLMHLSLEELTSIIKLLNTYTQASVLQNTLNTIKSLQTPTKHLFSDRNTLLKNIEQTHQILKFSYQLNDDTFKIITIKLQNKKSFLKNKIYKYKIIFSILILTFSFLMFLYYRLKVSNLAKDREIQDMTEILDEFVIFSKADKKGKITYASTALENISGYSQEEIIGSYYNLFKNENMDKSVYKKLWKTILSNNTFRTQMLNKSKDGKEYWVQETITPELDNDGNIISFNTYMVDITDKIALQSAHKKLQKLSIYDPLTQVYNRLKLDMLLQNNYESFQRYGKIFSVIIIDIDYFKSVNDEHGHLVGDEVLKEMASLIKGNLRESDSFGRWGGEEFLIISEFTISSDAYVLAEKIRKIVSSFEFHTVKTKTISLGLSQIDEDLSINDLLQEADNALYKAKNSGRNRTIMYKK